MNVLSVDILGEVYMRCVYRVDTIRDKNDDYQEFSECHEEDCPFYFREKANEVCKKADNEVKNWNR